MWSRRLIRILRKMEVIPIMFPQYVYIRCWVRYKIFSLCFDTVKGITVYCAVFPILYEYW